MHASAVHLRFAERIMLCDDTVRATGSCTDLLITTRVAHPMKAYHLSRYIHARWGM
jgi:hypothetical protein